MSKEESSPGISRYLIGKVEETLRRLAVRFYEPARESRADEQTTEPTTIFEFDTAPQGTAGITQPAQLLSEDTARRLPSGKRLLNHSVEPPEEE